MKHTLNAEKEYNFSIALLTVSWSPPFQKFAAENIYFIPARHCEGFSISYSKSGMSFQNIHSIRPQKGIF